MAAVGDIQITFKPKDRRLIVRLIEQLDTLIALLTKEELDGAQEQDSDVSSGPESSD
jgi:hypothetical protein